MTRFLISILLITACASPSSNDRPQKTPCEKRYDDTYAECMFFGNGGLYYCERDATLMRDMCEQNEMIKKQLEAKEKYLKEQNNGLPSR